MKNGFWKNLALFIASHPALVDFIIRVAARNHYSQLYNRDGSYYMNRFWLMPRCLLGHDENGNLFPRAWLPFIVRIHHIQSRDGRDLHDHPADYRTLILRGCYMEQDIYGVNRLRRAGDTAAWRAQNFHTITEVDFGGVWTLFIMGRKNNNWGFLVGGRKVPWRNYHKQKEAA